MSNTRSFLRPDEVKTIAVIGTGSVGASWIALFLARGYAIVAHDPAAGAQANVHTFVNDAWPALCTLGIATTPAPQLDRLRFVATAAQAAREADLIQENLPERPELKNRVLTEIDQAASPEKIIISSTGGIPPSSLQQCCTHPERLVVIHPFNPTHLIPLVEVVAGKKTSPEVAQWALDFSRYIGKQPIFLKTEAAGHMTNRLQFALVREAVHCLVEGIASADDIDAAVRYGLGSRWALMGSLMTLHLAGGKAGMAGILDHAGDAIETWWSELGKPTLTADVRTKLIQGAEQIAGGKSIDEWIQWRDSELTEILKLQQAADRHGNSPTAPSL